MKFNTTGLAAAGLELVPPFSVEVLLDPALENVAGVTSADNGGEHAARLTEQPCNLTFSSVARILPGRRVSGIARMDDGDTFFAKLFYGKSARRYWQRELQGAERLRRSNVPCANVLGRGASQDGQGYVILYRALRDARSLQEDESAALLAAVDILAGLHDANCVQTDVHFNNFVHADGKVFAVDADGVRRAHLLRQHFANLAMLQAQRAPWYDHEIPHIWQHYASRRGEYVSNMGSAEQLEQLVQMQRSNRIRRYLLKTQRECSEFVHKQTWNRNWLCDRQQWPALQRFMLFPEVFLGEGTPLKLGNSSTVVRVEIDGVQYIVKRYNIKSLSHRVRRWFKRRGRNAWRNGHWLAFLGIPTARPVALLENKWGWFNSVCYLVMPNSGEQNLGQLMAGVDPHTSEGFEQLAPQVISILQHLQAARLRHGDLKATNFVVHDGCLSLIDYDALAAGDNRADIERFLRNWENEPELFNAWRGRLLAAGLIDATAA